MSGVRQLTSQTLCQRDSSLRVKTLKYEAVVVGAGPAGIATIGNLVDQGKAPILWVDEEFQGGRLNKHYREVPSNTRVKLFVAFADALSSFREAVKKAPSPNAYTQLQDLPQDSTCHIAIAADLCLMLTEGLVKSEKVFTKRGTLSQAVWTNSRKWNIHVEALDISISEDVEIISDILILCTGSRPITNPLPFPQIKHIELDTALKPSILCTTLRQEKEDIVAVIGGSHSAILVLRNLYNLARSSHPQLRIKWFTRHPLRYAVERDGWILNDNTGLKGEVAIWARENLEEDKLSHSDVGKYLKKIATTRETEIEDYQKVIPSCTYIVQATGFTPREKPLLVREGKILDPKFNHELQLFEEAGKKVEGLYGAGIAWPEMVTDPEGNVSLAVGMWKFMKSLKKAAPLWTAD